MVTSLKPKVTVLVCAHDAGGANLIFAWATRAQNHVTIQQHVAGPADGIFASTFAPFQDWSTVDYLVCGTGWQSDFELATMQKAKAQGIKTIAYLDHWVNFEARFQCQNSRLLPDELWCADEQAISVVTRSSILSSLSVKQIGNYYWRDIYQSLPEKKADAILLVHEPVRDPAADHQKLIQHCLDILLTSKDHERIIFRVHPSGLDTFGEKLLAALQKNFTCDISTQNLAEDISSATKVVGYLSVVLAMVANMGKPVNSFYLGEKPDYLEYFGVR